MSHPLNYLALDLGAESGRAILGRYDGETLSLTEVHRFANGPVRLPNRDGRHSLHWDVLHLWGEIQRGIGLAGQIGPLAGIGLDAWGVDFGLLDRQGRLIGNPYHYRDGRTDGMLDEAFRRVPRERIFAQTGIQFMQINTLYQLLAMVVDASPALQSAVTFLTMPDLFNYWLTGRAACEFSNATTTQCYDPLRRAWATPLLEAMGIPATIFPEIVLPGTVLGRLSPGVTDATGVAGVPIIAPACHDTGSAVAAAPAVGRDYVWISSGTWSVLGAELPEPVITPQSLANNFTNEGGVAGDFRFAKNIMGLWLVQECRRTWAAAGQVYSYDELTRMAAAALPLAAIVDPDADEFLKPGDMPARIRAFCARSGQPAPETTGQVIRAVLEGIALKYRYQLERLEAMIGRPLEPIHIVGGGTQNHLLSQFTADATGREVLAGPIEATATGNLLAQLMATGQLASLGEARALVRRSVAVERYHPQRTGDWEAAYGRMCELVGQAV
jgi:sugar (pentulose or hexulose) kinase